MSYPSRVGKETLRVVRISVMRQEKQSHLKEVHIMG